MGDDGDSGNFGRLCVLEPPEAMKGNKRGHVRMAKHKSKHRHDKKQTSAEKGAAFGSLASNLVRSSRFRFAAAFTLACIAFYAIIYALPLSFTKPINEHVAATLGLVLNAFGIPVSTVNDTVSEGGLAFKIIPECTPLFTTGLFLSFVVFHPATVRQKATGLAMGIPALYLGNLVRLAQTFMVSRYDRRLFDVFHVYLGQVFTMFLVMLACVLWMKWIDREESKQGMPMKATGFLARFVLISGGVFLVWLTVHHWYIRFLDWFMVLGFSLFGHRVGLAQETVVYYETFSIVTFTSLVLAVRSVSWAMKIKGLAAGLGLLFVIHLFHRIDNALIAYFNFTAAGTVDLTLLVVGQYVFPFLLLIYMIRHQRKAIFNAPGKR
jgi:exosortase H (IPTLxxWG-CTERM-specific)